MDADRLSAQLRRVVDAAVSLDDKLLVVLFVQKAEPAPVLAEMLGPDRAELVGALGRLSKAGLVSHHRPEDEPIHWFATRNGRTEGEKLHRALSARLLAEPAPGSEPPEADQADEPGEHKRVTSRRRVSIDQKEKTGFSWD